MKNLVFIGGGHASLQVLKKLMELQSQPWMNEWRILLVNYYPIAVYSGMCPGVVSQQYKTQECMLAMKPFVEKLKNGYFLCGAAERLDRKNKRVLCRVTSNESRRLSPKYDPMQEDVDDERFWVSYDCLVINVGSQSRSVGVISGIKEHCISTRPIAMLPLRIKQVEKDLLSMRNGVQTKNVVVIGGGAAGFEIAFTLLERFKKKLKYFKFTFSIVDSHESLIESMGSDVRLGKACMQAIKRKDIKFIGKQRVQSVQKNMIITESKQQIPFDVCVWACGAEPVPFISQGLDGLSLSSSGYMLVNDHLQSVDDPNIVGMGDCVEMKNFPATPKAGVYSVRMGPIATQNVIIRMQNSNESLHSYVPQNGFLRLLNLGDGTSIASWKGWSYSSSLFWWLKDSIDRKFMNLFSPEGLVKNAKQLTELCTNIHSSNVFEFIHDAEPKENIPKENM